MPATRRFLVLACCASAVIGPPAADAATLTTSRCVAVVGLSDVKNMPIAGSGYTPGDGVIVRYRSPYSLAPTFLTSLRADAAGDIAGLVSPPPFDTFATRSQSFELSSIDGFDPSITATSSFRQVRFGYTTKPAVGAPTRRALHTVRGFPVGRQTYLHFRFRGLTRRTVRIGRAASPCGTASRRMALLPVKALHAGLWTIYADQSATYARATRPQLSYTLPIG